LPSGGSRLAAFALPDDSSTELLQFFIKLIRYNQFIISMLFQSDYWLASNYAEKLETILDFLETDEGIKTLVIIERGITNAAGTILESLKHDLAPYVEFITANQIKTYKGQESHKQHKQHRKTIYLYSSIDDALPVMKTTHPILALFV